MSDETDDPYIWLEEVESAESLKFVAEANEACLKALGDPTTSGTGTYDKLLSVLESSDRIPYVDKYGKDDDGNDILMNFWTDSNNPRGLWRKTSMKSYCTDDPQWEIVLDVDELAQKDEISWFWDVSFLNSGGFAFGSAQRVDHLLFAPGVSPHFKLLYLNVSFLQQGDEVLPRELDPMSNNGQRTTRALLSLSRGGSDAVHIREFDLLTNEFVTENPFCLPEAKSSASYKSRDVLLVGTDTGPDSLTDSGYPRQIREWVRGTDFKDAKVIFEGDKEDVSVSVCINDQRLYGGPIYEIRSRSFTFYNAKDWVRTVKYEELLAESDPLRNGVVSSDEFFEIDIPEDVEVEYLGNLMIIFLRSDWEPKEGVMLKQGSLVYVDALTLLRDGSEACDFKILFEPTAKTAYDYYSVTRNYLILATMDNVKSKLDFYKIEEGGRVLTRVGGDDEAKILDLSVSPVDPYENDEFWFTTSGYTLPSTLSIADATKIETDPGKGSNACVQSVVKSLPSQYDADGLEVIQCTTISTDGTEVPFFLVKKKGTEMNGKTPTLLYGYGKRTSRLCSDRRKACYCSLLMCFHVRWF
jgi:prolyl oligopeptidase